jgi:hypothetical protein
MTSIAVAVAVRFGFTWSSFNKELDMHPRQFALIAGLVMVIAGILAFVPSLNVAPSAGMPALDLSNSYSLFLGYIPMNILNKLALISFGAVGVGISQAPATALPGSIRWSRIIFVVMGDLAILGIFPQTQTLFGYMPLYSWDVVTHAVIALLGAYFGFMLTSRVPDQKMAPSRSHVAGVR